MTESGGSHDAHLDIAPDLVEYFIITAPDRTALAKIVPALAELVGLAMIRILDVAVLVRDADGSTALVEIEAVERLVVDLTQGSTGSTGRAVLLSDHDLELASYALLAGSAALVLVTEDRWAEPLSSAARHAGGRIAAGERIPASRVIAALTQANEDDPRRF